MACFVRYRLRVRTGCGARRTLAAHREMADLVRKGVNTVTAYG